MEDKAIAAKYSYEKGSPVLAVILGLLVDLGGTLVFGFIIAIGYGIVLAVQGLSYDQVSSGISTMNENPTGMIVLTAMGSSFSMLGGYVCARIVNYSEYKFAMVTATISAIYGGSIGWSSHAAGTHIALLFLSIGCVLLGAHIYVRMKRNRRKYMTGAVTASDHQAT